jgi:hypothetical protein
VEIPSVIRRTSMPPTTRKSPPAKGGYIWWAVLVSSADGSVFS